MPSADLNTEWGSSYRLNAAEKWRAKSARMGRDVTEAVVDYARPRAGMNILDVASGTGEPAMTLASRMGPSGRITASDGNSDLLAIAAQRAKQRGFDRVTTQQAEAQSLPFDDDSFDLATCRFGVMFFPDVQRALCELLPVLRAGARAGLAVWGPREQPYFSARIGIVHRRMGGRLIATGGEDPFRFSDPGSLSHALINRPKLNEEIHSAIRKYQDGNEVKFTATIFLRSGCKP